MSTALLNQPGVQESIHLVAKPEKAPLVAELQQKEEGNPFAIVFIACVIALHLAAAAIGSVAAWVYFLRDSGAFTR